MANTPTMVWHAAMALTAGILCVSAAGTPPKPGSAQAPARINMAGTAVKATPTPWPDITVKRVWVGPEQPPAGLNTAVGSNVQEGATITLGCEIGISGTVAPNSFYVKWSVDGVKTCGDGPWALANPPTCEFRWSLPTGALASITYISRTPGAHTYFCEANLDPQQAHVEEAKVGNNWKQTSFTTIKLLSPPPVGTKPVPMAPHGPRLWH